MVGYYSSGVKLPSTGGNNANEPIWKKLGYSSEQAYLNAMGGGAPLANYVSPPTSTNKPILQTPSLNNYLDGSVVTPVVGVGVGGGSNGGVTDEDVITRDPKLNNSTFDSGVPSVPTSIGGNKVTPVQGTLGGNAQSSKNDTSTGNVENTSTDGGNEDVSVGGSEKDKWNEYYDKKAEELINGYSTAKESLENSKRASQQNASITLDKLQKYLPTQIKAQGLGGLGVSESTMLQAHNNYANQMGEIAKNYSADMTTLDSEKISNMNELERYRVEKISEIEQREAEELRTTQKANNESFLSQVYNQTFTTEEEAIAYMEKNWKGRLSDEDYANGLTEAISIAGLNNTNATTNRQNSLYGEYSTQMEEAFGYTLIGSDGKVSKADYDAWGAKIEGWREAIGEDNYAAMKAQYEGYSSLVRNDVDQEQINREEIIDKWKLGVGDGEYTVHSDYGGGFSVGSGMKVKIKDGDEGMSLDTFVNKADNSGKDGLNSGEAGWFGSELKDSKAIAKLAKDGKLANGTIVDTNAGRGTKYWVYINGYFYRVEITQ